MYAVPLSLGSGVLVVGFVPREAQREAALGLPHLPGCAGRRCACVTQGVGLHRWAPACVEELLDVARAKVAGCRVHACVRRWHRGEQGAGLRESAVAAKASTAAASGRLAGWQASPHHEGAHARRARADGPRFHLALAASMVGQETSSSSA